MNRGSNEFPFCDCGSPLYGGVLVPGLTLEAVVFSSPAFPIPHNPHTMPRPVLT